MATLDSFPAVSGVVDSLELRDLFEGIAATYSNGRPVVGLFPDNVVEGGLFTKKANMTLDVAPFRGIADRSGVLLIGNGSTTNVVVTPAPASNSRIDTIYFRQNENSNGFADGSAVPIIGIVAGNASASPIKPSLAAIPGAVELGTILIPAGVTSTQGTGVIVTETFDYTTMAGGLLHARSVGWPLAADVGKGQMILRRDKNWIEVDGYPVAGKMPAYQQYGGDSSAHNSTLLSGQWNFINNWPPATGANDGFILSGANIQVPFAGDYEFVINMTSQLVNVPSFRFMRVLSGGANVRYENAHRHATPANFSPNETFTGIVNVPEASKIISFQMFQDSGVALTGRPTALQLRYLGR